ncbi:MAG: 50S ribosomal protein L11 methyltransferase [Chloroflexi bacterium]|nr:50S ribosomal protein L11 methyltransferase [Chloroflexota bacterium]
MVASTPAAVPADRARLGALGLAGAEAVQVSGSRVLLRTAVPDQAEALRVLELLRREGRSAVLRPEGGAQLAAWERHTEPVVVGGQLAVCFVWSEHPREGWPAPIELDPNGGFGSGQHPATRVLLEELVERIHGGERVLDVGCGSGVLGLAALRLGAASALGTDLEVSAVEATQRNAALNELRMDATAATLAQLEGAFDVVLANIGRAGVVELAPDLIRLLAPGGWLAVSGFPTSMSSTVEGFLKPLEVVGRRAAADWEGLVLKLVR